MLRPFISQKNLKSFSLAKFIYQHPIHCLAFGLGAGLSPKIPGTIGTLLAFPLYYLCVRSGLSELSLCIMTFIAAILGIFICGETSRNLNVPDHSGIVWDELVAMFALLIFTPNNWATWGILFILFRFFDILKPFPIRTLDQKIRGGIGIMLDDLIAALFAFACWVGLLNIPQFKLWIHSMPLIIHSM